MGRQAREPVDAVQWLRQELGGRAPRMQRRLLAHATRAGIQHRDLRAAASELGVEIVGANTRLAFWRLRSA